LKLLPALIAALLSAAPVFAADGLPQTAAACFEQAALQPRTVFDVVVATYTTVVERGRSIREINVIRPIHLPPQAIAHGLTLADFRVNSTTRSEATRWGPDGRVCAWIGGVVVNLTPGSLRIYIPQEYRPKSCESKQLLLHEMEHERLFRQGLEKAVERMRFALAHAPNLPGPLTPVDAAASHEAYVRFKAMVEEVVRPVFDDFVRQARLEQEALDTPETYRRLGESCSGWKRT
jgi:hypothetical protein